VMLAQRPPGGAPAIQASAGALPFADGEFDAAMAVLSDHHWPDRAAGLRELKRVARRADDEETIRDVEIILAEERAAAEEIAGRWDEALDASLDQVVAG